MKRRNTYKLLVSGYRKESRRGSLCFCTEAWPAGAHAVVLRMILVLENVLVWGARRA